MDVSIFGMCVPWSKIVSSAGLVLDISGAALLFKFGLPADVRRKGESFLLIGDADPAQIAKGKLYDRYGKLGICLLIIGFVLQLASNFL